MYDFEVKPLLLEDLLRMKPLLDKSAGYDSDLEQEIEFFKSSSPKNWFCAKKGEQIIGFVRAFPQGTWGTVELYSENQNLHVYEELVRAFNRTTIFQNGFRLRFEIAAANTKLIQLIKDLGYQDRVENFLHYELDLSNVSAEGDLPVLATDQDFIGVQAAIENLHTVSVEDVASWVLSGNIYIERIGTDIASAAQVYEYGDTAEINRVATNIMYLQKGSANRLLSAIHRQLKKNGIKKVFLKVDEKKTPARALYEKLGYSRVPEKDQAWLSRIF